MDGVNYHYEPLRPYRMTFSDRALFDRAVQVIQSEPLLGAGVVLEYAGPPEPTDWYDPA